MAPLFSIITVTYNAASTIRPTLESVGAQTCTLYEHIIVDGQSADSTLDIIASIPNPRRRLTSRPDDGIYDAMNRAIADAKGDYLIFLNAGDRFHSPDTLRRYADAIMANDYPGIVYGQTELVDAEGRALGPRHLYEHRRRRRLRHMGKKPFAKNIHTSEKFRVMDCGTGQPRRIRPGRLRGSRQKREPAPGARSETLALYDCSKEPDVSETPSSGPSPNRRSRMRGASATLRSIQR